MFMVTVNLLEVGSGLSHFGVDVNNRLESQI